MRKRVFALSRRDVPGLYRLVSGAASQHVSGEAKRKLEMGFHNFEGTSSFHNNHGLASSYSQHAKAAKVANLPADQPIMPDHIPRQTVQNLNTLKRDSFSTIKT